MIGVDLFARALRERPIRTAARLAVEYAGYVAALWFGLLLVATRLPLRVIDELTGLGLRERSIDLIASLSSG